MSDETWGWLYYRGMRAHLGLWRQRQWRKGQKRWRALHPEPPEGYTCALCEHLCRPTKWRHDWQPVKDYDFTLDHIIPVAVILSGGGDYPIELLWHPSNLQAAHASCNSHKSDSLAGDTKVYGPPKHVSHPNDFQNLLAKKEHVV